jgi:hypothetical protein
MTNVMLNSTGRVFISESACTPFEYAQECGIEMAGITASLGDITQIYCPSSVDSSGYDVYAQIKGAESAPTTSITAYLPADGQSQLLRLAKRGCLFNMVIKYGACVDPTNYNEFDYALFLEGVRITSYSTTPLTSRSPETRAAIDLTFAVTIKNTYDMYNYEFLQTLTESDTGTGAMQSTYAYNDQKCEECESECVITGIQKDTLDVNYVRKYGGVVYNTLIATTTPHATIPSFTYTDGKKIYAFVNLVTGYNIYSTNYSDIDEVGLTWTNIFTGATGNVPNQYHVYAGKLYFITTSGSFNILTLATGTVVEYAGLTANAGTGVWGYLNTVYAGDDAGGLFKYANNEFLDLSSYAPNTGLVRAISVQSDKHFTVINNGTSYCTTDGGLTWTIGSVLTTDAVPFEVNKENPWYAVLINNVTDEVFESFDGGLTFRSNTSYIFVDESPTSVSFCDSCVYISTQNAAETEGAILTN